MTKNALKTVSAVGQNCSSSTHGCRGLNYVESPLNNLFLLLIAESKVLRCAQSALMPFACFTSVYLVELQRTISALYRILLKRRQVQKMNYLSCQAKSICSALLCLSIDRKHVIGLRGKQVLPAPTWCSV